MTWSFEEVSSLIVNWGAQRAPLLFRELVTHVGWEVALDDLAALMAHLHDVVASRVLNGFMEREGDSTRSDIERAAGHYLVAAVDSNGYHGQAELQRQLESAVLEGSHLACVGAPSLGKDDYRHAAMQFLLGRCHGVADALGGVGVHHDVAGHAAGCADDGDVGDAFAHHPLEIVTQKTVDGEYIICTLMIGDKYITGLVVNEFAADDLDTDQMDPAPHAGPPLGRIITPIVLLEQATQYRNECSDDAIDQHDGRSNAPLIYTVNIFHRFINHYSYW